jgi:hypothetical protein
MCEYQIHDHKMWYFTMEKSWQMTANANGFRILFQKGGEGGGKGGYRLSAQSKGSQGERTGTGGIG